MIMINPARPVPSRWTTRICFWKQFLRAERIFYFSPGLPFRVVPRRDDFSSFVLYGPGPGPGVRNFLGSAPFREVNFPCSFFLALAEPRWLWRLIVNSRPAHPPGWASPGQVRGWRGVASFSAGPLSLSVAQFSSLPFSQKLVLFYLITLQAGSWALMRAN